MIPIYGSPSIHAKNFASTGNNKQEITLTSTLRSKVI